MAGALFYAAASPARAQVVTPPASEVPIPVKPKTDSGPDSVKTDTVKAPIGRFADPALYEIGPQYDWNRAQLFATGALTVVDLLDRIPESRPSARAGCRRRKQRPTGRLPPRQDFL